MATTIREGSRVTVYLNNKEYTAYENLSLLEETMPNRETINDLREQGLTTKEIQEGLKAVRLEKKGAHIVNEKAQVRTENYSRRVKIY